MDKQGGKPKDEAQSEADLLYEKEFRRKSVNHSFMATLYAALGGASFIGVLSELVKMTMGASSIGLMSVGVLGIPIPIILGAFMVAGIAATYFAEREYTELNCLRDDRMARQNAQALDKKPAMGTAKTKPAIQAELLTAPADRRFTDSIKPRAGEGEDKSFSQLELARREAAQSAPPVRTV